MLREEKRLLDRWRMLHWFPYYGDHIGYRIFTGKRGWPGYFSRNSDYFFAAPLITFLFTF
jgi:hypothetical protein